MSNIIVMAFSPLNIVGCFLKKRLTKGGSRGPQDPPSLHPWLIKLNIFVVVFSDDRLKSFRDRRQRRLKLENEVCSLNNSNYNLCLVSNV